MYPFPIWPWSGISYEYRFVSMSEEPRNDARSSQFSKHDLNSAALSGIMVLVGTPFA